MTEGINELTLSELNYIKFFLCDSVKHEQKNHDLYHKIVRINQEYRQLKENLWR